MSRRLRPWWTSGLGAAVLLVVGSHVLYWYWPRLRVAEPEAGSRAARLVLAPTQWAYCLWIPYPHQNLGRLERRLGGVDRPLLSLQELLGLEPLELPSFGPFRIPPARELALATDRRGEKTTIVLHMYPAVRWLLRTAGVVARNPWLRGGDLEVAGRRLQIRWQSGLWVASTENLDLGSLQPQEKPGLAIAVLRLGQDAVPLRAGVYRVSFEGSELVAASVHPDGELRGSALPDVAASAAAAVWTRAESDGADSVVRALAVLPQTERLRDRLPPMLVFHHGGGERWQLPGESLMSFVGQGVLMERRDDWRLAAYDRDSLEAGRSLLAYLDSFRRIARQGGLLAAGELDLAGARPVVLQVGEVLAGLPASDHDEARRWLALADLLVAFEEFQRLSIRLGPEGRLEMRLGRRRPIDTGPRIP